MAVRGSILKDPLVNEETGRLNIACVNVRFKGSFLQGITGDLVYLPRRTVDYIDNTIDSGTESGMVRASGSYSRSMSRVTPYFHLTGPKDGPGD